MIEDALEHDGWELNRTCKDFINDYGEDVYYATIHAPKLFERIKELEDKVWLYKRSGKFQNECLDYASY
jgi:hypothetical protein